MQFEIRLQYVIMRHPGCLDTSEFKFAAQLQSVLQDPYEAQMLWQKQEGVGLSLGYRMAITMHTAATAKTLEIVSGEGDTEEWKAANVNTLPKFLQVFRSIFAEQLDLRLKVKGCPDKHVLLALRMDPTVDTSPTGKIVNGKAAMLQLMDAEHLHVLRHRYFHMAKASAVAVEKQQTDLEESSPEKPKEKTTKTPPKKKKKKNSLVARMQAQHQSPTPTAREPTSVEKAVDAEIKLYAQLSKVPPPHRTPPTPRAPVPTLH